jgi:transposase InsO family protein
MAESQNLKNHTRLDPGFHFTLVPATLLVLIGAIGYLWRDPHAIFRWWLLAFVCCFIWAIFKIRLYALRNQDRIIRLEETVRMQRLCPDVAARVGDLRTNQFTALRFCSDAELPALAKRALDEKLSNQDIKQAIKDWRGDHARI